MSMPQLHVCLLHFAFRILHSVFFTFDSSFSIRFVCSIINTLSCLKCTNICSTNRNGNRNALLHTHSYSSPIHPYLPLVIQLPFTQSFSHSLRLKLICSIIVLKLLNLRLVCICDNRCLKKAVTCFFYRGRCIYCSFVKEGGYQYDGHFQ